MCTATRGPDIHTPLQNTRKNVIFWLSCTLNIHFYTKSAPKKNTIKHKVLGLDRIQGSPTLFSTILLLQRSSRKKHSPPLCGMRQGAEGAEGQGGRAGLGLGLGAGWRLAGPGGWLTAWWLAGGLVAGWWHGGWLVAWRA